MVNPIKQNPYSKDKKVGLSELDEQYSYSISKSSMHPNIIDKIEKLAPPRFNVNVDLKKAFYEDQADKYL